MERKNAEISARIAEMIENLGANPNSFAKMLGYARAQTIYDIINGKSAPSYDFFNRFANTGYSDIIDLQWLLTGKGSMMKNRQKQSSNSTSIISTTQTDAMTPLLSLIKEKDEVIRLQAEEIGRLREKIEQMSRGRGHTASDANTPRVANAG